MSKGDISYTRTTQQHKEKNNKMINNYQKEIQTKLTKGLLDMIILQLLDQEPMHGYQLITKVRKSFGVYFGPSTVYPLLGSLKKKGYVKSTWNMDTERPRKVYELTKEGETVLNFTEGSLNLICKTIINDNRVRIEAAPLSPRGSRLQKSNAGFAVL
jgi:DNA-binding PadR family transcriptional regulator